MGKSWVIHTLVKCLAKVSRVVSIIAKAHVSRKSIQDEPGENIKMDEMETIGYLVFVWPGSWQYDGAA